MNINVDPPDSRPDPELGLLLRTALSAGDDTFFLARVLARLGRAETWGTVLAGWARVGIAAAVLIAAFAGWLSTRVEQRVADLSVPETFIATEAPAPQAETMVSALFGEE